MYEKADSDEEDREERDARDVVILGRDELRHEREQEDDQHHVARLNVQGALEDAAEGERGVGLKPA